MSLSQKHSGLVLVPWFNSDEWRYVYNCAYSQQREKQEVALDLLKIWKLRTPILSAGVEGTLILLEALLLDCEAFSYEHVSNTYAIALMRFCNLAAANNDKQGSFTKTSEKNDLPKWIVNLRHDIAHGHELPSLFNLRMGIDFGFKWLREKYWEPHSTLIKDYYIGEDSRTDNLLANCLNAFVDISVSLFDNKELEVEVVKNIKQTIFKKHKKTVDDPQLMLDILLEMIKQSLEKERLKDWVCLDRLASEKGLLKLHFNEDILDENFKAIWRKLLDVLHDFELLFVLLNRLCDVTCDISQSDNYKKMAALWIREILASLADNSNENDSQEVLEFQQKVLLSPNEFTHYFMDNLFNLSQDAQQIVTARFTSNSVQEPEIYTIDHLKMLNLSWQDFPDKEETEMVKADGIPLIKGTDKWTKIHDTSMFKHCPIGVLPHQIGRKHQFLDLD